MTCDGCGKDTDCVTTSFTMPKGVTKTVNVCKVCQRRPPRKLFADVENPEVA